MIYKINIKSLWTEQCFHWLAAGVGALLAIWVIWNAQGVINKDATLYVGVASLFASGEWKQGIELYNWPFYPLILAFGHVLTGLHFQTVGHLFSIISFSLSSAIFVLILKEAGGNRHLMLAGLLVFLASPYLLGHVVAEIVRDHGFWVFLLWALWCLMRFYNTDRIIYALGWGSATFLAMLFRVEGLSFLILLPLAVFFQTRHTWLTRLGMFLQAQSLLVGISIILLGVLLLNPSLNLGDLGRLQDPLKIIVNVYQVATHGLQDRAQIFGDQVLGKWLEEYAFAGLLLTLGWAVLAKVVGAAGLAQSLLCAASCLMRRFFMEVKASPVLVGFALIALFNCLFIILHADFLAERMTAPLAFSVKMCAAFALAGLYQRIKNPEKKIARVWFLIVAVLLAGQLIKTVWSQDSGETYEIKAVKWVEANKKSHERVYYDSKRLRYYAGEYNDEKNLNWSGTKKLFQTKSIYNYDYLLVHGPQENPDQEKFITEKIGKPIMEFDNERSNKVLIYRVFHHSHDN